MELELAIWEKDGFQMKYVFANADVIWVCKHILEIELHLWFQNES